MCRMSTQTGMLTAAPPPRPVHLYRPFFLSALTIMLTTGAGWGLWFLYQIAVTGKTTGVNLHAINAHGQTVIYGFLGLFIMGFAYQVFPKIWAQPIAWSGLCVPMLAINVCGMLMLATAEIIAEHPLALGTAIMGGLMHTIAVSVFVTQLFLTFRASPAGLDGAAALILAAAFFYGLHTPLNAWHTCNLAGASRYEAIHYTSVYQPSLRYLQLHGMTLLMIFGVGARMLPNFFVIPRPSSRKLWTILWVCASCVILESILFVFFRYTETHWLGKYLLIPWLGILGASLALIWPWKPWRAWQDPMGRIDRIGKFARASWIWLIVSLVLTILQFPWSKWVGIYFSHSWYGASRQAFTVGFATMMIMGFSCKIVPNMNGVFPNLLTKLTWPFMLINVGLALHIGLQIATDVKPGAAKLLPIAGIMQWIALCWWAAHLVRCMWHGYKLSRPQPAPTPVARKNLQVLAAGN